LLIVRLHRLVNTYSFHTLFLLRKKPVLNGVANAAPLLSHCERLYKPHLRFKH
jgi:hypothetical protein